MSVTGGGILEFEVRNILRLDGTIKANSLNKNVAASLNGASGGSGGSIWIRAGAFVGKTSLMFFLFYSDELLAKCFSTSRQWLNISKLTHKRS